MIFNSVLSFVLCPIGRKNEVRIGTENQAGIMRRKQVGIMIEGIVVTAGGIMIVVVEIVIGTMIEIADMIASVIGILIATEVMIQEVTAGHALGQGNVREIMIATGFFFFLLN